MSDAYVAGLEKDLIAASEMIDELKSRPQVNHILRVERDWLRSRLASAEKVIEAARAVYNADIDWVGNEKVGMFDALGDSLKAYDALGVESSK